MSALVSGGRRGTQVLWRQLLNLQPTSALTLQAQLRAQLISAIGAGSLPAERALPSSRALADQLNIARNTVVIVYQQLANDGYLIARHRRGYYPNPAAIAQRPRAAPWAAAGARGRAGLGCAREAAPLVAASRFQGA
jgi:GntR family transcriptional regulator/MocR family aminotransferase